MMADDGFWGHDFLTRRYKDATTKSNFDGGYDNEKTAAAHGSSGGPPGSDPMAVTNKFSLLVGRIRALAGEKGISDKVEGLLPPADGSKPLGLSQMNPKKRDQYFYALAKIHDKLQADAEERGALGRKGLLKGQDFIPEEAIFTGPNNPISDPRILTPRVEEEQDNSDLYRNAEEIGPHGPLEAPRSQREYELKMERLKGILSPEELAQVQDEWKDQLLNPIDTTKDRRRMMFMTGLGKAFVSPASEGKYAVPGAVAALKLLNEGQEQGLDEFDRQEDAFHARTKNLQAGLDYDSKYAQTQKDLEHPTLYIDGKPINDAEFELLGEQSQELMAHLAGQATGNDPNVVGPMAERYESGQMTGNAKAQLQMAQAEKYAADAEIAKLREARAQDLAPLEKDKLEAQIAELEWKSREKQAAINAINAMLD
jgi:hypothetical protein